MRLTRTSIHARGERGQTIILFVAVFTVLIAALALALDQGVWLGHRRVSQKDADTAARGGAMAYLNNPTDVTGARDQAASIALANGADTAASAFPALLTGGCIGFDGKPYPNVPSVEAQIHRTVGSLVTGLVGLGSVDTSARATACVGQPSSLIGSDSFYIAPGQSSPGSGCFDSNGNPRVGSICPLVASAGFADTGSRGLLSLQHDPLNPGAGETRCYETSNTNVDWQVVKGSKAICNVGDTALTKQTTVEGIKAAVLCRLNGYANDKKDCDTASSKVPGGNISSASDAPGNVCDDDFHVANTTIPPFADTLTPPFPVLDVRDSPSGLDDYQEVFRNPPPDGGPPTSLPGPATPFLVPSPCSGPGGKTYTSPRIATVIITTVPPIPGGVVTVERFATFYILGCQELDTDKKTDPAMNKLVGPIDPYCTDPKINADTTNLVGIFVRAFIPDAGGPPTECGTGCTSKTIVLVR
jgi:hypothetical protein